MAVHNRKYRALTDPAAQAGRALLALRVALGHHVRVPTCQPLIGAKLPAPAEAQNGLAVAQTAPKISNFKSLTPSGFLSLPPPSTNIFTGLAYDGIIP